MRRYSSKHIDRSDRHKEPQLYKKGRRKVVKVTIQIIILALLTYFFVTALVTFDRYTPFQETGTEVKPGGGFIAVSYFGVEKYDSGSSTLISEARLAEQIKALKDSGYVTITQQDILDYYKSGKALPEKALFLMFEDGRRDTALFSQSILEKNNYIATVLTYADRFENDDEKFLTVSNVKSLLNTSFWELGSNGYRLSYINVFDRYGNYFGNLTANEFISVNQYLERDYNHYLMDYLRDEDKLRAESDSEMQQRIAADYDGMEQVYTKDFGKVPLLYVLMHSNTGKFGTNDQVSEENKQYIYNLFAMNFNREGSCNNTADSSIYDLTRMQPQADWYSNHLLMRIADDTKLPMSFVTGDTDEAAKWSLLTGAAEYRGNAIVLTSNPHAFGKLVLSGVNESDVNVSVTLNGNVAGNQGLVLRADESLQRGIYIGIENNRLLVREISGGTETELYSLDLFQFDGGSNISVEEDEHQGLIALQNALLTYDSDAQIKQNAQAALSELKSSSVTGLGEGGTGYVPTIDLTDRGSRKLNIALEGSSLTVWVDGKLAIKNLKVNILDKGTIALESSALIQELYSQRNLNDDVYDAVFTDLSVTSGEGETVYQYVYGGWQLVRETLVSAWEKVATFFVDTF